MEVGDDHYVYELVDAVLLTDVAKVRVFLHVGVLHVDAHVEYNGPVLDFAYDARTPHFLPCPQWSNQDLLSLLPC